MVQQAELILRVITVWFLVLSHFFRDGMGPFKASAGQEDIHRQEDVQRFEPHLGYNWLSCGVFLVKSRHVGLPLAQTKRPNWQSLLAGGSVAIQT